MSERAMTDDPVASWTLPKRRVLVPFDFTEASRKALNVARTFVPDLGTPTGGSISVVHVIMPPPITAVGLIWQGPFDKEQAITEGLAAPAQGSRRVRRSRFRGHRASVTPPGRGSRRVRRARPDRAHRDFLTRSQGLRPLAARFDHGARRSARPVSGLGVARAKAAVDVRMSRERPTTRGPTNIGGYAAAATILGILLSGPLALLFVNAMHPQPPWQDSARFVEHYHPIQVFPYFGGMLLNHGAGHLDREHARTGARTGQTSHRCRLGLQRGIHRVDLLQLRPANHLRACARCRLPRAGRGNPRDFVDEQPDVARLGHRDVGMGAARDGYMARGARVSRQPSSANHGRSVHGQRRREPAGCHRNCSATAVVHDGPRLGGLRSVERTVADHGRVFVAGFSGNSVRQCRKHPRIWNRCIGWSVSICVHTAMVRSTSLVGCASMIEPAAWSSTACT